MFGPVSEVLTVRTEDETCVLLRIITSARRVLMRKRFYLNSRAARCVREHRDCRKDERSVRLSEQQEGRSAGGVSPLNDFRNIFDTFISKRRINNHAEGKKETTKYYKNTPLQVEVSKLSVKGKKNLHQKILKVPKVQVEICFMFTTAGLTCSCSSSCLCALLF